MRIVGFFLNEFIEILKFYYKCSSLLMHSHALYKIINIFLIIFLTHIEIFFDLKRYFYFTVNFSLYLSKAGTFN